MRTGSLTPFSKKMRLLLLVMAPLLGLDTVAQTDPASVSQFNLLSEQAAKANSENRLNDAATLFRKALLLQPQWADGWWALGTLHYDQNRYTDASREFEKVVALQPKNGTAHAMLGLCEVELRRDALALRHFGAARQLGILDDTQLRRVVLYQLGSTQLRMRKFGDASVTFGQLVIDGVRTQELTDGLGMAALLIQPANIPEKGTPSREVVEEVGQAVALASLKGMEAARRTFERVAGQYPEYPNLHYAFGRFLLDVHEPDEAVKEFQHELQNNPAHLGALLELAGIRYRVDSAAGVKYAEQAVKLNPQLPFGHYLLGLLYLDTDRPTQAIPELETARKSFAKEPKVYFALGNAYAKAGKNEQAARMRAEFVRLNALKTDEPGASVYGEQPSGLVEREMQERQVSPQN